jgi:hypothetical protein
MDGEVGFKWSIKKAQTNVCAQNLSGVFDAYIFVDMTVVPLSQGFIISTEPKLTVYPVFICPCLAPDIPLTDGGGRNFTIRLTNDILK